MNQSDKKDDGGPAFPLQQYQRVGEIERSDSTRGMTLRDYFAAKAMPALIALCATVSEKCERSVASLHAYGPGSEVCGYEDDGVTRSTWASEIAWESYMIADAMIKMRKKEPKND